MSRGLCFATKPHSRKGAVRGKLAWALSLLSKGKGACGACVWWVPEGTDLHQRNGINDGIAISSRSCGFLAHFLSHSFFIAEHGSLNHITAIRSTATLEWEEEQVTWPTIITPALTSLHQITWSQQLATSEYFLSFEDRRNARCKVAF